MKHCRTARSGNRVIAALDTLVPEPWSCRSYRQRDVHRKTPPYYKVTYPAPFKSRASLPPSFFKHPLRSSLSQFTCPKIFLQLAVKYVPRIFIDFGSQEAAKPWAATEPSPSEDSNKAWVTIFMVLAVCGIGIDSTSTVCLKSACNRTEDPDCFGILEEF